MRPATIVTVLVLAVFPAEHAASAPGAEVFRDAKNDYFMFLPPTGWTPQTYNDPRTKVAFVHPEEHSVLVRLIVREAAPGENFESMLAADKKAAAELTAIGVTCTVTQTESHGLECSEIKGESLEGPFMLRKFITSGLHFNIYYGAATKTQFAKHYADVRKSLATITVTKTTVVSPAKAREQQIANRIRLAQLAAKYFSVEKAKRVLDEAQKDFPESQLIRDAMKQMETGK